MSENEIRPPYGAAAVVSGMFFLLYVVTLAPTTAFWDASEYIATAHILGIPHPPGNPLFVVLARVWSLLLSPLGLSVAVRVNLFAALTSALASGFLFLVAHRLLTAIINPGWPALAGAAASALLGATTYTVWNQSTVNEKVYTVSVLIIAVVSWLALRWRDRREEPGSERLLLVAGFLIVLGSTNHLMSVLPAPALILFVLLVDPRPLLRGRFWLRAVPLALVGLSFNLILPVRAARGPVISEGHPVCEDAAGAAAAVFTLGRTGCPALAAVLRREQYGKPPISERQAPLSHQLLNWLQYFDWQWARSAEPREAPGKNARLPFTLLFGLLGLVGLAALAAADREAFAYLGSLALILTLGLVFYLNFKYGYSLAPEVVDRGFHEVRERDYFFIAGFLLWGVLAGLGLAWAWDRVAAAWSNPRSWAYTSPVLLVAAIPLLMNGSWASRAGDYAARDWAYDVLVSVEPYGVLFTSGDNDTFPLWYLQEVEGIRRDVTVIVGQYLNTPWYPRQLKALTLPGRQRSFLPGSLSGPYEDSPAPTSAILVADSAQLDRVGGGRLDRDVTVPFPQLAVVFPQGMALDRRHRIALSIIHDSIDERPIYFASSAGMMAELGLDRWAVRQGLVSKLVVRSLDEPQPEGFVQASPRMGGEWFDHPRSMTLYHDYYSFRGLRDREVWFDRASLSIPLYYYGLALQLSDLEEQVGAPGASVLSLRADAQAFFTTGQGGRMGSPGA